MASSSWGSGGWGVSLSGLSTTKNLLDRVRVQFDGTTTYIVGPTVEYAIYHELGTSKMGARPFMRPAAQRVGGSIERYVQQVSAAQGIPLDSEENIVKCAALAVEAEAKDIADAKDIRETGDLIASIEARPA